MTLKEALEVIKGLSPETVGALSTPELLELERVLTQHQGSIDEALVNVEGELEKRLPR